MSDANLPPALCEMGYTRGQVQEMFGTVGMQRFEDFMQGQTIAGCPCKAYDHSTKSYKPTKCQHVSLPAQTVYFTRDVLRFVQENY